MTTVDLDELLTPGGGLRVMQSLAADGEPPDAMIGTELAAYTIESRLGTGGMSTVYAGRRTDGEYEHAVAIKLMRNVDPDARSQQRLRLERQILADLSHPNIARLIDGGVAPDGRPYLVMERIDGLPIDRFCARNGLDLVERIKLFTQVVRALEHAHASAVIHRDIKPSNILVTASGTAKLLDFGIAKTVDEATQETERLLTLTFASPEQLDGERITVATDIYQLGIVLYLLVTGSNPFGEPTDPQRQVVLAVTTSAPERPSQRLQRIGKGREARRVRGDLDAIILKCLRRDPDERYESARALLNDLKAFRKAKPVDARAGGFGYSVSRLLARNRLATAIAAVGFLAVLAVLVVSFANISAARNEALARAQTAERVQALTREILGAASPYAEEEPGSTRELLAAWEREVRVTLAAEPAVQADLLHLIGSAQLQQGWPGEATDSLAAALAVAPPNTPLRARVLTSMASLALDRDEVDAALDRLEEARPWLTPPDRARWHALQGNALARTSRIDAALTHYAAAADEFEALGSAYQDQFVSALVEWAGALVFAEQPREAAEVMERALGGSSRPLSLQGLRLADALEDYGGVLGINSRWRTALEVFDEALEIRRSRLSPDHPDISRLLGEMARAWTHLDEPARAALLFEEAIGHFDARGDGGSRGAMILRFNYSNALENLGRVREAERVLLALQDLMRVHAPDDPNLCKVMNNIGDNRRVQGRFEDAEAILMDAVACKQRAYGADAQTTGNSTLLLADAMLAQGLTEGVAVLVDDGLRIRTAQFGEDSPRLAYPLELRGELRSQRGDHGGAVADLEHVIELRAGNGEDATLHYAQTWERLGWAQARAGRPEASRVAFDRAFAAIRAGDVMSHPAALRLRVARLESHARAGQPLPEAPSELLATVLAEAPYRADLAATLAGFQR